MNWNEDFWNQRWMDKKIGWDVGYATPPITHFMENYPEKEAEILIPGCGNAHEAEFLLKQGFTHITLVDISQVAVDLLNEKFKNNSEITLIHDDFFNLKGAYDLIIEQTFFCALNPQLREEYAKKMYNLLKENGRLIGVLFDVEFKTEGPPFGGSEEEYIDFFQPFFEIEKMELCYNSIGPRDGNELFINMKRK